MLVDRLLSLELLSEALRWFCGVVEFGGNGMLLFRGCSVASLVIKRADEVGDDVVVRVV